ncbi:MAG: hypothetical protein U0992_12350 [Planctomycetaceae bacterium]
MQAILTLAVINRTSCRIRCNSHCAEMADLWLRLAARIALSSTTAENLLVDYLSHPQLLRQQGGVENAGTSASGRRKGAGNRCRSCGRGPAGVGVNN